MPELIESPTRVEAAGTKPKLIDEYAGRVNTGETRVSMAHMRSPAGWVEPGQRPEFDEYTLVLGGALHVEHEGGELEVRPGQAVLTRAGEWVRYSTPEGAEYVAVCLPAFSPDTVHRDDTASRAEGFPDGTDASCKGDAIGVVVHPRRDSHDHIECVVRWAAGHGKVVRGLEEARELMPAAVQTVAEERLAPGSALVIGLGGDGTILRALKLATEHEVPVLGVNLGRLAFLAEVNLDELPAALDQIDRGDYRMEDRATMTVSGSLDRLPLTAFNDSALTRVPGHGPAALAVEVEDEVFARYTTDALVIATPTGSTAYSFAAGGPIVSPRHRGLLVTPVAPHAAFDRPVFLHPEERLRVHVLERSAPLLLEADGQRVAEAGPGDLVEFAVAERPAQVLRLHPQGFYERARRKLQITDSSELAPQ